MIIRIFTAREPAKPLNDAQMCGSFLFLRGYLHRKRCVLPSRMVVATIPHEISIEPSSVQPRLNGHSN